MNYSNLEIFIGECEIHDLLYRIVWNEKDQTSFPRRIILDFPEHHHHNKTPMIAQRIYQELL